MDIKGPSFDETVKQLCQREQTARRGGSFLGIICGVFIVQLIPDMLQYFVNVEGQTSFGFPSLVCQILRKIQPCPEIPPEML